MDLKVYKRTRYQNIYKHKNGNYVVMINKPVKSSISRINGEKIWKIEEALKIRDNPKIKLQKKAEIIYKDGFDELWFKYIDWCIHDDKQDYSTYNKKEKLYYAYLKGKFKKQLSKTSREEIIQIIDKLKTTNKQKNEVIKILKAFFNWCVYKEKCLLLNPINKLKDYKVTKHKMNYWIPDDVQKFFKFMNNYINNAANEKKEVAYRTKIFALLGFSLGNRVGETRALTFNSVNKNNSNIVIEHSIEYNPHSTDYLSTTKTYASQREIDVSSKIIEEIEKYKYYLINELDYNITNNTLIFLNHSINKPFSDATLRKNFYKFCDMAEVPHIRMYDLRHTYVATMMAEGKELYLISERLGHTSFSTTVNKYGHLSNEVRKEIAKTTDKYI